MAQQIINLGTAANTGTGDQGRTGGDKVNDNFTEVYHQAGMPWDSARTYATNDFSKVGNTVYVAQQASTNVDPTTDTDYSHWRPLHTYNILGTVSATGTYPNLVPTGAIIESGSNANGTYIKFADGTMICYRVLTELEVENTSINANNTFFNYPAAFSDMPIPLGKSTFQTIVTANQTYETLENFFYVCNNNTRWNARLKSSLGSSARSVVITAFGRWK